MKTKLMITLTVLPALCAFAFATPIRAGENDADRGKLSAADYKFARAAARGGMFEVELGNFARERSTDPAVQKFGERMVSDHGKADDQLTRLASGKGAILPKDLNAMQQRHVDHLKAVAAPDFDREYINLMVRDHMADVKEFQRAADTVKDADLKDFAKSTLAMIQGHLELAKSIQENFKVRKVSSR